MPSTEAADSSARGAAGAAAPRLPLYLPWIDVLRFVACFLVIALHALPAAPSGLGHAGVALFFSISGFLIGRILVDNNRPSTFYARRLLRIYPAYLATIVLYGLMTFTPLIHDAAQSRLFWRNLPHYLTFTFQLSPDEARLPLFIVWSLCVEELFYLLLPLVFQLRHKTRITVALLAIVAVLLVPRLSVLPDGSGTWFIFPVNLFAGVLLALAKPRARDWFPIVGLVAVALMVVNAVTGWFHAFGPVSALLCTAAVWSFSVYQRALPAPLEPLRRMGKLSYGMYLLHLFCLPVAMRLFARLSSHPVAAQLGTLLLTTALTVVAAAALQRFVEEPVLNLRPALKRSPRVASLLAAFQVSFIPLGILLTLLARLR
jgi:peptidoglycan/LPS O-acetylase OafA/YrhL